MSELENEQLENAVIDDPVGAVIGTIGKGIIGLPGLFNELFDNIANIFREAFKNMAPRDKDYLVRIMQVMQDPNISDEDKQKWSEEFSKDQSHFGPIEY